MARIPGDRGQDGVVDRADHASDFRPQDDAASRQGQRRGVEERPVRPEDNHLHGLAQRQRLGRYGLQMRVHPQEDEGCADGSRLVEAEDAVLVRPGRLQPCAEWLEVGHQPVEVRHLRQFRPVAEEEDHQVRAKLGVGLGHAVPGQRHHRLQRALDHAQRRLFDPEDHGHDGASPAGAEVGSIGAGKQRLHILAGHLTPRRCPRRPALAGNGPRAKRVRAAAREPRHPEGRARQSVPSLVSDIVWATTPFLTRHCHLACWGPTPTITSLFASDVMDSSTTPVLFVCAATAARQAASSALPAMRIGAVEMVAVSSTHPARPAKASVRTPSVIVLIESPPGCYGCRRSWWSAAPDRDFSRSSSTACRAQSPRHRRPPPSDRRESCSRPTRAA